MAVIDSLLLLLNCSHSNRWLLPLLALLSWLILGILAVGLAKVTNALVGVFRPIVLILLGITVMNGHIIDLVDVDVFDNLLGLLRHLWIAIAGPYLS